MDESFGPRWRRRIRRSWSVRATIGKLRTKAATSGLWLPTCQEWEAWASGQRDGGGVGGSVEVASVRSCSTRSPKRHSTRWNTGERPREGEVPRAVCRHGAQLLRVKNPKSRQRPTLIQTQYARRRVDRHGHNGHLRSGRRAVRAASAAHRRRSGDPASATLLIVICDEAGTSSADVADE